MPREVNKDLVTNTESSYRQCSQTSQIDGASHHVVLCWGGLFALTLCVLLLLLLLFYWGSVVTTYHVSPHGAVIGVPCGC